MDRKFVLGLLRDWGLALALALGVFVIWSVFFSGPSAPVATGQAPDFALPTLVEGEEITLSAMRGTPVVVNFWATWCGPCKKEIPELVAFAEANPEVPIIGVSVDNGMPIGKLRKWAERLKITYPVAHDTSSGVADMWGVSTLPTTFVVTADGHLGPHRVGTVDLPALERMVAEARAHSH